MEMVDEYVMSVAEYKSGNLGRRLAFGIPIGHEIYCNIQAINRQLTKLAKRVAELRGIRGFGTHMAQAGADSAPEELENIAAELSCVRTEGFSDWFPQRETIIDLLELVRTATGRPHYAEVYELINAALVWHATKNRRPIPDPQFDPDSLKMLFRRHKQRETARLRKQSETRYGVRKPDV
jgi:hypothetical protein